MSIRWEELPEAKEIEKLIIGFREKVMKLSRLSHREWDDMYVISIIISETLEDLESRRDLIIYNYNRAIERLGQKNAEAAQKDQVSNSDRD